MVMLKIEAHTYTGKIEKLQKNKRFAFKTKGNRSINQRTVNLWKI